MAFLPSVTKALNTEGILVDDSDYYDSAPKIYGDYITWLRGIDIDSSGSINYNEPQWVMLHRISTGETTNITPTNAVYLTGTTYHHSREVKIWNNRLIYEKKIGTLSYTFRTYIYNINNNTEYIINSGLVYTAGSCCDIYENIVLLTHWGTNRKQGYIYNLETDDLTTIIPSTNNQYSFGYGFLTKEYLIYSKYVYLSAASNTLVNIEIIVYKIDTGQRAIFNITDYLGIYSYNFYPSDVYENYFGFNILELSPTTNWNVYILDYSFINWTMVGSSKVYDWEDMHDYLIPVDIDSTDDIAGGSINGNFIVYSKFETTRSSLCHIIAHNYISNKTYEIASFISYQQSADIYGERIVWMDNRDEPTPYPPRTYHDFDIYRTQSITETMGGTFMGLLPIFMIGGVFVLVGVAIKSFGGGF